MRGAFDFAYQQLAAPCDEGESLLSRLIRCSRALPHRSAVELCCGVADGVGLPGWTWCSQSGHPRLSYQSL